MSWHYLQGQAAACWDHTFLDGAPDALLKLTPTAVVCSSQDKQTGILNGSPFGMTFAPSTAQHGVEQLTLLLADFPAKTSARQVKVQDLPETVRAFGLKCSELLAKFGLAMSSRKTVRICVRVDSAPSSKDLPAWGMTADGECWELGSRVRHIDATVCGSLLPTLRANKWGLPDSHGDTSAWGMLPTITANLYGSNKGGAAGREGPARPSLERLNGGLSLPLREWIMGWPIGWTACEPLATGRFQEWRRWHGAF